MTQYDETNRGALFNNKERKAQNPKAPDYSGNINVNGVEFWLSGWLKDGKKGKFFSLSVQPKEAQVSKPVAPQVHDADIDESIPF